MTIANPGCTRIVFVLLALGCSQKPPAPAPTRPATVETAALQRPPAELAFIAAVRRYVDESRSVAKLLTLTPDSRTLAKRCEATLDLYTRIPDAPISLDPDGKLAESLEKINAFFDVAKLYVEHREQFFRLNDKVGVEKCDANCKRLAAEQKDRLAAIDAALPGN